MYVLSRHQGFYLLFLCAARAGHSLRELYILSAHYALCLFMTVSHLWAAPMSSVTYCQTQSLDGRRAARVTLYSTAKKELPEHMLRTLCLTRLIHSDYAHVIYYVVASCEPNGLSILSLGCVNQRGPLSVI